jgi:hypothetical protein
VSGLGSRVSGFAPAALATLGLALLGCGGGKHETTTQAAPPAEFEFESGSATIQVPVTVPAAAERRCGAGEVEKLVRTFVTQFNTGHTRRLDRLWARDPDFQWYSTSGPGKRLDPDARNRSTLMRYFGRRHQAGERLRLTLFKFNGNASGEGDKPYGNFEFELVRKAWDLAATPYVGKGATHCRSSRDDFFVWSMSAK